jgi:ATP-binding cassette subfamily C (CFTR/MRP) protein 1
MESRLRIPIDLDKDWPSSAKIEFKDIELRYRPNTELVLKGLSFAIQGGQKIGIVGRTGAGKSTLSMALTRIIELESGHIKIDGLDISEVPLAKLREKITIIPQDPSLFTGSLKFNIDPTNKASEFEILDLVKRAGLESLLGRGIDKKEEE